MTLVLLNFPYETFRHAYRERYCTLWPYRKMFHGLIIQFIFLILWKKKYREKLFFLFFHLSSREHFDKISIVSLDRPPPCSVASFPCSVHSLRTIYDNLHTVPLVCFELQLEREREKKSNHDMYRTMKYKNRPQSKLLFTTSIATGD